MHNYIVIIDGRVWSTRQAAFVEPTTIEGSLVVVTPDGRERVDYVYNGDDLFNEQELILYLKNAGFPLGELTPLEEVQEAAQEALKQVRLAHEYAGPLIPVNGVPVRFPSEVKDETRLNSLSLMFAADPGLEVPDWKVADDVYVTMTAPLLMQIRGAGSMHIAVCFSVERAKREEIKALQDSEAVAAWLASELNTGWPE